MASKIVSVNIRFNLSNPTHKKAWDYLSNIDKDKYKSYTQTVIKALIEFFDKEYKIADDPYFETREKENEFVERIVEAVKTELKFTIPTITVVTPNTNTETTHQPEKEKEIDEELVDWDFIG